MSDQFASASVQTNQVLSMSNTTDSQNTAVGNTVGNDNVAVGNTTSIQNVAVGTVETEIASAVSDVSTSDADVIADKIIAANMESQQEKIEQEQEDTGKYGDESKLIALIGFVPGFNSYQKVVMADQAQWYASKTIYTTTMPDNINAFYGLAGSNISKMNDIIELQPKL
jgi:hypothetical protein